MKINVRLKFPNHDDDKFSYLESKNNKNFRNIFKQFFFSKRHFLLHVRVISTCEFINNNGIFLIENKILKTRL